jgi:hypothetical protein
VTEGGKSIEARVRGRESWEKGGGETGEGKSWGTGVGYNCEKE